MLDDQDLMMRLFRVGDVHRVGKCLYLQRVHLGNTQSDPATNAFIQQQTVALYQQHVEGMFGAWAQRQGAGHGDPADGRDAGVGRDHGRRRPDRPGHLRPARG